MKIKPLQMTKARRKKARSSSFHWWLEADKPKGRGRLAQQTKWNQKVRLSQKSEFIQMAEAIEARALARSA